MLLQRRFMAVMLLMCLLLSAAFTPALLGQEGDADSILDSPANIIIQGPVEAININIITIAGLDVILPLGDPLLDDLTVGDVLDVSGNIFAVNADTRIIIPLTVVRLEISIIVPVIIVQGTVEAINVNIITVYGLNIQLNPADPILASLQVGDEVVVNGNAFATNGTIVIVVVTVVIIETTPEPEITETPVPEATDEPEATEEPGEDDDTETPVIIVIEGPVQAININIITIFGINIQLAENDPLLTIIQIGDIVQVEGEMVGTGTTIIIIAITVIIVDIDIIVDDGGGSGGGPVWQDTGNCSNPPPPWAPAHGWRARCEGGGGARALPPGQQGRGRGRGN